MTRFAHVLALVVVSLFLAGCRGEETGDFFRFDGRLFVFNYRVAAATYLVNIKQLRSLEPGHVAVVSFEDPAGGPPLVVRESIYPNTTRTTINSPPVFCIIKDRPYKIMVRIESADGKVIQEMETTLASLQDQDVLPDMPLVNGPLYTPNSGAADAPGNRPTACPSR